MKLSGNTVLITGGGSGIGRGLAEALQAEGNTVIIAGRRKNKLDEVVAANPGMAAYALDIDDAVALTLFVKTVTKDHPELNVLINNAGIMRFENVLDGSNLDDAEATITTNLSAPIRLTAALLPHFLARPIATIVNVTSGLAFVPLALAPTYSATKAALHSYSQSLRFQLADTNVDVIEIAPPAVQTDILGGPTETEGAMPLQDFIAETMAILRADPQPSEIYVEDVKALRFAEANGTYDQVFGGINNHTK